MLAPLKCYIIEDEPLAVEQLQSYIFRHKDLILLGHTDYIGDPAGFITEIWNTDILFLDIQVSGGNINQLKQELKFVPFIVVTSALSPLDYPNFIIERVYFTLRKPTTIEVFEKCIQNIIERKYTDI